MQLLASDFSGLGGGGFVMLGWIAMAALVLGLVAASGIAIARKKPVHLLWTPLIAILLVAMVVGGLILWSELEMSFRPPS